MLLRWLNPIYLTLGGYYGDSPLQVRADLFLFISEGQRDSVIGVLCAGRAISSSLAFFAE